MKGMKIMKKILLCCAAGMSTSLLVNKMKAAAEAKGEEVEIWAEPLDKAPEEIPKSDIVLLGPQVKYAMPELKKIADEHGKKIDAINMTDYGMMNGAKVLEAALKLLG
jgi:cellobiose-specific phosphotransferase enzyme IIB component